MTELRSMSMDGSALVDAGEHSARVEAAWTSAMEHEKRLRATLRCAAWVATTLYASFCLFNLPIRLHIAVFLTSLLSYPPEATSVSTAHYCC